MDPILRACGRCGVRFLIRRASRLSQRFCSIRCGQTGKMRGRLDAAVVKAIRADGRSSRQIAAEHGISHTLVGTIKRGEYYAGTTA